MTTLSAFLTGLALGWSPPPPAVAEPAPGVPAVAEPRERAQAADGNPDAPPPPPTPPGHGNTAGGGVWQRLIHTFRPQPAAQVRIEQRIMWRISPMPGPSRDSLMAVALSSPAPARMTERRMGRCVPMSWIRGSDPQGNSRLLLFLRDRRLLAANLEKACSARDFYSGFYVDKPNADGQLCADRDRILARNGARCRITGFRLLVPRG